MSDLTVIFDKDLEIGAIVDLDTNQGWGPICVGPQGGELLAAFVAGMPFDMTMLTPEQAKSIFMSVFQDQAAASAQAAGQTPTGPVESAGDPTANEQAQATAEAVAAAGEPPAPAPADTDMAADQSETDQVTPDPTIVQSSQPDVAENVAPPSAPTATTNCLVCNADGTGSNNPQCPVCNGTGKVAVG